MNCDTKSEQFGEIKHWNELTKKEKRSGEWVKLPDGVRWQKDPNARLKKLFGKAITEVNKDAPHVQFPKIPETV